MHIIQSAQMSQKQDDAYEKREKLFRTSNQKT